MWPARTDSPILVKIYRNFPNLDIGLFKYHIFAEDEYANNPEHSVYDITHDDITVPFLLAVVDVSVLSGSKSTINLAEFIWENSSILHSKCKV